MADTLSVSLVVNGEERPLEIEPRETLAEVLRDRLALKGTKISCDSQVCGACTVLVDGLPVSACTYLAVRADGRRVRTVEGLAEDGRLNALQQAFIDHAGFQCGFCTPGMLMAATALLDENSDPSRDEVVDALEGNICRCTGYLPIVDAVLRAAGNAADGRGAISEPGTRRPVPDAEYGQGTPNPADAESGVGATE